MNTEAVCFLISIVVTSVVLNLTLIRIINLSALDYTLPSCYVDLGILNSSFTLSASSYGYSPIFIEIIVSDHLTIVL